MSNPILAGFNPDPSIVRVGEDYYLVTSSFEYLPGLPIYHSVDLANWSLVGHVINRADQIDLTDTPTNGGLWAPTIRFHNGTFYVAVTDALGSGMRIFTATDPAGPWSSGVEVEVQGIDPDLAWDQNGDCFLTYSGLILEGAEMGTHLGIRQVAVNPNTGAVLGEDRALWSGSGLMFPEAPHLYRVGDWWYLLIAEGGTERGHGVSIARSKHISGPFEPGPNNPFLSARSTSRAVQNTGHGDFVETPDGQWHMVLLGVRTFGLTRGFSPNGRETFITKVTWSDGWPSAPGIEVSESLQCARQFDFCGMELDKDWISIRRFSGHFSSIHADGLHIVGSGASMSDLLPAFVGIRPLGYRGQITTDLKIFGVGGLSVRMDEASHFDIEVQPSGYIARYVASGVMKEQFHPSLHPLSEVTLYIEFIAPEPGFSLEAQSCDVVSLGYVEEGQKHQVALFDGRSLSTEVACSFTGRVSGIYCSSGEIVATKFSMDYLK